MHRDRLPLILGIWAIPASIAVSEFFLSIAGLIEIVKLVRRQTRFRVPGCLWLWLVWAGLESFVWALSPEPLLGWSEIRHLLLLLVLFITLPGLKRMADVRTAWIGVFIVATLSCLYLIGQFIARLFYYREEIAAGGLSSFYLRSGGFLNHWMVFGTVEILVFAGLLSFWSAYPEDRRRLWPVVVINGIAIVLSLTRMAWITCLLLLVIHMVWKRSKWVWAVPLVALIIYMIAPAAVRTRVTESLDPSFYSNTERVQMLEVGWKMVRDHPMTGIGPGRVEKLYTSYLSPQDYVPAYHGHLHNNLAQIAAQFGIPVTLAALVFVCALYRALLKAWTAARDGGARFVAETALMGLTGFLFAGLFEYTYGHALGLIMISFTILPALFPHPS